MGISEVSPLVSAPTPGSYPLCSHVVGVAGADVNITCDNNAQGRHIGRYVIIQIVSLTARARDMVGLCEVSVFEGEVTLFAT